MHSWKFVWSINILWAIEANTEANRYILYDFWPEIERFSQTSTIVTFKLHYYFTINRFNHWSILLAQNVFVCSLNGLKIVSKNSLLFHLSTDCVECVVLLFLAKILNAVLFRWHMMWWARERVYNSCFSSTLAINYMFRIVCCIFYLSVYMKSLKVSIFLRYPERCFALRCLFCNTQNTANEIHRFTNCIRQQTSAHSANKIERERTGRRWAN